MRARTSRRGAMTLVEMMVATTILTMLIGLAVGSLIQASGPTIEGTVRGYMLSLGDAAILKMEREISSADFFSPADVVGSWSSPTFTTSPTAGADLALHGSALQFFPITGWNTGTDSIATGTAIIYQFRDTPSEGADSADNDQDGLVDELQLVRIDVASGLVVTVLEDIVRTTAATEAAEFRQVDFAATPVPQRSQLEMRFTLSRRVGLNEFVTITFSKVITLRNAL